MNTKIKFSVHATINLIIFIILATLVLSIFSNEARARNGHQHLSTFVEISGLTSDEAVHFNDATVTGHQSNLDQYPFHLIKIRMNANPPSHSILHIEGIYARSYRIYDQNGELLAISDSNKWSEHYIPILSELYIPIQSKELYLLTEKDETSNENGIRGTPVVQDLQGTMRDFIESSQIRRAIAMFLILLSLILFIMSFIIKTLEPHGILISIAWFSGLFGIWCLLDFVRHSRWIIDNFTIIPVPILLLFFFISKNFMTCSFVWMNKKLFDRPSTIQWVQKVFILTLLIGIAETLLEITKLVYWSSFLETLDTVVFFITNWTIILGSLLLVYLSIVEAISGSRRAIVLAIGLVTCLSTFVISQTTSFLISHWGVIALLISISIVVTDKYNDAQESSQTYLQAIKRKNIDMQALNLELEAAQTELLLRLGSTVDFRSKETSLHVQRVTSFTRLIAMELNLSDDEVERISLAAALHDIGKVGIPDRILNAPGKLSPDEYEEMKIHSRIGFDILNGSVVQILDIAAIIALTHHEKYDGSGYPDGLKGDDIPLYGQIVAAADVLDALLSTRVYKSAWSFDDVMDYFAKEKGRHFNPKIAAIVIENRAAFEDISQSLPYA